MARRAGLAAGEGLDAFHGVEYFAKAPGADRKVVGSVVLSVERVLPGDVGGAEGEEGGKLGNHPGEGDIGHVCVVVGAADLYGWSIVIFSVLRELGGYTLPWTPGNQHCLKFLGLTCPAGFSHIVGEKGLRCSSRARAWKAFSTPGDTAVSMKEYSLG